MYYLAIGIIIGCVAFLPVLAPRFQRRWLPQLQLHPAPAWLPPLAAFAMTIAFFLPDIHISPQTATFQEHFVGGGLFTAAVFVYFKQLFGWQPHPAIALIALFTTISTLGVTNELIEFTLKALHLARINITDTSWDLVANTLGAFAGYALLALLPATAAEKQPVRHQ